MRKPTSSLATDFQNFNSCSLAPSSGMTGVEGGGWRVEGGGLRVEGGGGGGMRGDRINTCFKAIQFHQNVFKLSHAR